MLRKFFLLPPLRRLCHPAGGGGVFDFRLLAPNFERLFAKVPAAPAPIRRSGFGLLALWLFSIACSLILELTFTSPVTSTSTFFVSN